jgi:hypothetical protein
MTEYRYKTLEEQLYTVQDAIEKIETGAQEYQIGNRKLTKADLQTLYAREASLRSAIAAQNGQNVSYARMDMT